MERYLVIVSRDRPELLETFKRTLASGTGGVDILLDRRTQLWGQPNYERFFGGKQVTLGASA